MESLFTALSISHFIVYKIALFIKLLITCSTECVKDKDYEERKTTVCVKEKRPADERKERSAEVVRLQQLSLRLLLFCLCTSVAVITTQKQISGSINLKIDSYIIREFSFSFNNYALFIPQK